MTTSGDVPDVLAASLPRMRGRAHDHWTIMAFVAALRRGGVAAPMVTDGAMNGAIIVAWTSWRGPRQRRKPLGLECWWFEEWMTARRHTRAPAKPAVLDERPDTCMIVSACRLSPPPLRSIGNGRGISGRSPHHEPAIQPQR